MHARRALIVVFTILACFSPRGAHAGVEPREIGSEAVVRVEGDGTATVNLRLRWHLQHGPLKYIDVTGVDADAEVEADVAVALEDGQARTARALRRDDRTIRVDLEGVGLPSRGTLRLDLRWRTHLLTTGGIARDGAMWRVTWSAPVATDGFDGAQMTLDLPAAAEPPRALVEGTGVPDESVSTALRRSVDRDVITWVRPHVARGESASFAALVDPHAFVQVTDPHLRRPPEPAPPEPSRGRDLGVALGLAFLALMFGGLIARKRRAPAASSAGILRPRGFAFDSDAIISALGGLSFAGGIGLQCIGRSTAGSAFLALAMLAASSPAPRPTLSPRGPGRWLALRRDDAFGPSLWKPAGFSAWLPIAGPRGWVFAMLGCAIVCLAGFTASKFDADGAWLAGLDALVLVPLFVTGPRGQRPGPPHANLASSAAFLSRLFDRLSRDKALRVAPWARVRPVDRVAAPPLSGAGGLAPWARDAIDELRLLVLPRPAMPGVVGIEVGLAWSSTPVGWTPRPEVLARVLEGSAAAARLASEVGVPRLVPGRRADERVAALVPRLPNRASTEALVRATVRALADRRLTPPAKAWPAPERRETPSCVARPTAKPGRRAA